MRKLFLAAWLTAHLVGCPRADTEIVRVGVETSLSELGLVPYLVAAYEETGPERVRVEFLDSLVLRDRAEKGELDIAFVVAEQTLEALAREGLSANRAVFAHEEFIFVGPFEDFIGSHKEGDAITFIRSVSRSNHRYLKARPGSVERARHDWLFQRSEDRAEPGSFFETKLEGRALVEHAIETRAFALVRRSALLLAAAEGKVPHRVYKEREPQLVLRLHGVQIHPARTGRPARPGLLDFLATDAGRDRLRNFGKERFGFPVYAAGDAKEGEGAELPEVPQAPEPAKE